MSDLKDSLSQAPTGQADALSDQEAENEATRAWRFVLASASPRRHELIKYLGLPFEIVPSLFEESMDTQMTPSQLVENLAQEKAKEVFERLASSPSASNLLVLGADTIVALDGQFLGKPANEQQAFEMLKKLSGRCHEVHTGVAAMIGHPGSKKRWDCHKTSDVSRVYFRTLSEDEIEYYIKTKEPMDKAGAYALQGIGSAFVERIDGCFTNIIGLPVPKVVALLRLSGIAVMSRALV